MHPPLLRSSARAKKTLNSAFFNSNRSRPKVPLGNCMASTYRFTQSTLPDPSDVFDGDFIHKLTSSIAVRLRSRFHSRSLVALNKARHSAAFNSDEWA